MGLNHVDMDACKAKGVQVFNAPGLNANAVAELTFSKMLDLSRHTIPANYDVKVNKTWDKYKFVGRELRHLHSGPQGPQDAEHAPSLLVPVAWFVIRSFF